jgi:RNA polymerase sigma-70 factor (TIGR02960 family)
VRACHDVEVDEDALLRSARDGDEQAFGELTEPHRAQLRVHCYRMLGSVDDAEDVVQETLLAAWRGLAGFEGRASLRNWLYRIATNRCLNALRDARRTVAAPVPPFEPPEPTRFGEVTWLQPYPDALLPGPADATAGPEARYTARETIELTFVSALQQLPPRQLAALVLRDVLGFRTAEVADMLDTSQVAVKSSVQRARASLRQHRGDPGGTRPAAGRPATADRALAQRFADAFGADDIDTVIGLLTDDAWLAMPPAPHEYQGRAAIAGFLHASAAWRAGRRFRLLPVGANAQPAFACYLDRPAGDGAEATGLIVLSTDGGQIRAVTRFLDGRVLRRFGLAPTRPP